MRFNFIPCSMPVLIMYGVCPIHKLALVLLSTDNAQPNDDESHPCITSQLTQRKSTVPFII